MTFAAMLLAVSLFQQPDYAYTAPGAMWITNPNGAVPMPMTLKHTDVHAQIAGFGARVTLTQTFNNPSTTPIEATYTFPLPNDAAVDKMSIHIGERTVLGQIKPRDEARCIYEAAKSAGQTAALLDQQRPNIFSQSVANIMPGKQIEVEISYVEILKYQDGQFEFTFPMVVGPRFIGSSVTDGPKIAPPITAPKTRTGQTISLGVDIDAGAPIEQIDSVLHKITIVRPSETTAHVELRKANEIPNRDFILRYQMATDSVKSAFVSSYDGVNGGQFALIVMPPKRPAPTQISPREIIFVIDRSGSQQGFPIEKSKELTLKLMGTLRAGDTFNVISFGMNCAQLWQSPQSYTETTAEQAKSFIGSIDAAGGTNVQAGILQALSAQNDSKRTRIVLFNTDGFIGNEGDVLRTIEATRGRARIFTFGIGNSVNRYIIDAMASEGRGDAEYVTLAGNADAAVARLTRRLETPVLMNVSATFSGTPVDDVTPSVLPDLFDEKPIVILGHYQTTGPARVVIKGDIAGRPWSETLDVNLPVSRGDTAVPTLWARKRIDDIERKSLEAQVCGDALPVRANDQIRDLAMTYGIVSSQTSFVAVEPRVVNVGGRSLKVQVPVEMASGVSYNGIFGQQSAANGPLGLLQGGQGLIPVQSALGSSGGIVGGGIGGFAGGAGGAGRGGRVTTVPGGKSRSVAASPANPGVVSSVDYDASDNTLVVRSDPEAKIAKALKKATGELIVQVSLSKLDDDTLKALKDAGLKIDDKEATLKVVFGRIDAKNLIKLAKLAQVERIDPVVSG